MTSSFFKLSYIIFIVIFLFTFFVSVFFTPTLSNGFISDYIVSKYGFAWPIPGHTTITSYYGKRVSPTLGASSFHKGIDIGAPEGTPLIAIYDGTISYTGFLGGGGYTITLSFDNFKITYCHTSPFYIVNVGDNVSKGQIIGYVGPKYVYGVPGNTYTDVNGNPTNGATTGTHLHIGFRLNDEYVNPLDYLA